MNSPDVDRRVAPDKANITDNAAKALKTAGRRLPRLWAIIIIGVLSWLLIIFIGWVVYSHWIAPGLVS